MDFRIIVNENENITDIVKQINSSTRVDEYDKINVTLDFSQCSFVKPSNLVVLAARILYLQHCHKINKINIINSYNSDVNTYISRMDFFNLLQIPFMEDFTRHNSAGRFVTIKQFTTHRECMSLVGEIEGVLRNSYPIQYCEIIGYALNEIMDNVIEHSGSPISGLIVMQDYPNSKNIEFCLVDCGDGIKQTLKRNDTYKNIANRKALEVALNKNISCCKNETTRGNGLYYTPRLLEATEGEFVLYSHDNILTKSKGYLNIDDSPFWGGTIIKLDFWKYYGCDFDCVLNNVFEGNIPWTFVGNEYDAVNDRLW